MINLAEEYYELALQIGNRVTLPTVDSIYLPEPAEERTDNFGFVFLADGSCGPFYISMDDTLAMLRERYPADRAGETDLMELLGLYLADDSASRALALGTYNAISHFVMGRAGFSPATVTTTKVSPSRGDRVAVIGYIRPLIEKLLARGHRVLLLEKNPARVEPLNGMELGSGPAALSQSDFIYCTAATLINDSLGEILRYRPPHAHLSLVGPSGSGLPDILFKYGVGDVGGVQFRDPETLRRALSRRQGWGEAGSKYQLAAADYPGVDKLLATIAR